MSAPPACCAITPHRSRPNASAPAAHRLSAGVHGGGRLGRRGGPAEIHRRVAAFWTYFYEILPTFAGYRWQRFRRVVLGLARWLLLLAETLLVAYVGTCRGRVRVLPLLPCKCQPHEQPCRLRHARLLEFCRTVPDIVFALLLVYALGLGPIPGVPAIAIDSLGALGKQYAEVVRTST